MHPIPLAIIVGLAAGLGSGLAHGAEPTPLSAFAAQDWVAEKWNKATGTATSVAEGATGSASALKVDVAFSGKGFEWFTIDPTAVILWVRGGKPGYPIVVKFKDAKGKTKIGDQDIEWSILDAAGDAWQQRRFDLPASWEKPLTITAVAFHNWEHQNEAAAITYQLDELQALAH